MDYKSVNDKINQHYAERGLLRKEICAAIHDMLTALGGKVYMSDDEWGDYIGLCYDGGNDVEYASTMSCRLDAVTATVGKDLLSGTDCKTFSVDCESESDMEECRLMFDDVATIFDLVYARYNWMMEKKDE